MSLFLFLTVLQAIVAAALVGVILMQRSEGGGLGVGGSPSGFMSARGAADFLTRATAILAATFVLLSIVLAALAVDVTTGREIDTSLDRSAPAAAPATVDPLAGAAGEGGEAAPVEGAPAAPASADDPLAGAAQQ
jgi:preprotein translocase subunit SecG